jgi:transposase
MAFREVSVVQINEVLRRWLHGDSERSIAEGAGVDRKTVRRYVCAAVELGLIRDGGEAQLTDELIGQLVEKIRPHRPDGHGKSWQLLLDNEEKLKDWVEKDLTVVKIGILLERSGIVVPHRTLARFSTERLGTARKRATTVRVDDPPPGQELQVDFGRLGLVPDGMKRRVCQGLIFTACFSRHQFVWPTFSQSTEEVILGFEAAWSFFGGIFPVVIPDNMGSIVVGADPIAPRFNDVFLEYAQARGFFIDPARVRSPTDKPRVERVVHYVQHNFFAGEEFNDLAHCRAMAETWSAHASTRIHGSTQCRPIDLFTTEELALLLGAPSERFDVPVWSEPKVHKDLHVEIDRALYSAPHQLRGRTLKARRDSKTVKLYLHGELVKVHPRMPRGQRSTDPKDLPEGTELYATRDVESLQRLAASHGASVGHYATAILDTPLPWTKMRQVYRLLGLAKKYGSARLDKACSRALEAEAVDVKMIARMLERALESTQPKRRPEIIPIQGRFARDPSSFAADTAKEA